MDGSLVFANVRLDAALCRVEEKKKSKNNFKKNNSCFCSFGVVACCVMDFQQLTLTD